MASRQRLAKQLGSFGLVGILNTVLDFAVLNFCRFVLHLPPIPANLVSTTVAQAVSFLLNKNFVFAGATSDRSRTETVIRFIAITATGLYVIQTLVIWVFTHAFTLPGDVAHGLLLALGINGISHDAAVLNTAKLIATVFSASWNFVLYKKAVFTGRKPEAPPKR
ncbi:GtrA family protein [Candidatus Saccharibacteria bacterium]|nr:GtrA family protein [Candidatus Saccharibacteria bacterium]